MTCCLLVLVAFTYSVFCMFIFLSSLLPVGLFFHGWGAFSEQWPGHTRNDIHHCAVVIIGNLELAEVDS